MTSPPSSTAMSSGTSRPITHSGGRIGPSRGLDVDVDFDFDFDFDLDVVVVVVVNLDGDDDVDGDGPR
jgi:hypothetical protein